MVVHVSLGLLNQLRKIYKNARLTEHFVVFIAFVCNGFTKSMQKLVQYKYAFFYLILNVPSTVFQVYRDGSSWVEPVLS